MIRTITANELEIGDTIFEGNKPTKVTRLDKERCKNNVHVNDKDCYGVNAEVRVQTAKLSLEDL